MRATHLRLIGLALGVLACVYTAPVFGQNVVNGTIKDPNGNAYANGSASALLAVVSGQVQPPSTNVTTNAAGFFTMTLATGSYSFIVCAAPIELPPVNPVANPTPRQICFQSAPILINSNPQDVSTTLNAIALSLGPQGSSAGGISNPSSLNNIIFVDGVTYPRTNAGIQAAVNATPSGGTVFLPQGNYNLSGTGAQQILITQPINFICAGWGANLQLVPGAASAPLLRIAPSGVSGYVNYGTHIQDCQFSTSVGGLGTYAIQVDTATTGSIGKLLIDHIYVGCTNTGLFYCVGGTNFGTGSIFFNNPTGTGGYYQSSISHSKLYGNIKMTRAGDSITVSDNEIIPNTATDLFYVDVFPGSTQFRFLNNFMRMPFRAANDTAGSNALQDAVFDADEWEPESSANLGFTIGEVNNAMIDLDGSGTSNNLYITITRESFQMNANNSTLNAIRLNHATQTMIGGRGVQNFFGITTGGSCALHTCKALATVLTNAFQNHLGHNVYSTSTWSGSSGAILDDLAGNTFIDDDVVGTASTLAISQASGGGTNIYGFNGLAFLGVNGANRITDGSASANVGLDVSSAASVAVIPSTVVTVANESLTKGLFVTDSGSCTMASGTCSAQGLAHTYAAAPRCFANWTGSGTLTGILKVPSTTSTVTPASSVGTDTAVVNWECHASSNSF